MTHEQLAALIESESQRQNDAHYGITAADPHYIGGPSHNDDRLRATVIDHDGYPGVRVTDGNAVEFLTADPTGQSRDAIRAADVPAFVADWLAATWDVDPETGKVEP